MKAKDKAALLAAFDVSPGSIYDEPGELRSLAESHPEAVPVLAAIAAGSPAEMVREIILALPVPTTIAASGEHRASPKPARKPAKASRRKKAA